MIHRPLVGKNVSCPPGGKKKQKKGGGGKNSQSVGRNLVFLILHFDNNYMLWKVFL